MKSVKNGLICALWLYIRTLEKACENAAGQQRVYSVEERLSDSLHFSRTPPPWSLQCQLDRPWTRWQGSQRHDNSDYERRLKRRILRIWHYIYSWDIELLSDFSPCHFHPTNLNWSAKSLSCLHRIPLIRPNRMSTDHIDLRQTVTQWPKARFKTRELKT